MMMTMEPSVKETFFNRFSFFSFCLEIFAIDDDAMEEDVEEDVEEEEEEEDEDEDEEMDESDEVDDDDERIDEETDLTSTEEDEREPLRNANGIKKLNQHLGEKNKKITRRFFINFVFLLFHLQHFINPMSIC